MCLVDRHPQAVCVCVWVVVVVGLMGGDQRWGEGVGAQQDYCNTVWVSSLSAFD